MTFKEKIKKFWQEHKTGIIIGGITTGAVIIGCIISANKSDDSDFDYDFFEESRLPDLPKSTCELDHSVFTDEEMTKSWDEELYRENWDKVTEFAKTLKLQKGESYILDDSQRYYDEPWYNGEKDDHVIVSHMVNWDGCYPPENKEEEAA